MTIRQLDEEAVFEVAREIGKPDIRAKYLMQIGADHELRSRLEHRLRRRRWQFGLRSVFVAMLVAAALSTGLAMSFQQVMRARQQEQQARLRAEQAMRAAEAAAAKAAKAALETAAGQSDAAKEEDTP